MKGASRAETLSGTYPHFHVEDAIKFVSKFNETEPYIFLFHFEHVAPLHG